MSELRIAGWLLVLGGVVALAGAFCPPYEQWYAPLPKALRIIAAHPGGWRCIHAGFLGGTVLAALGLTLFAHALGRRAGSGLATVVAAAFAIATILWVVHLAFRLSVTPWAARELVSTGTLPALYAPLNAQAGLLFGVFAALAYAADAGAGWAFLQAALAPRWIGWAAIALGLAGAPAASVTGPWVLYVPLVLLGGALTRAPLTLP